MPIGSIISQPASNSLNAAYRPIQLTVSATRTGGDPVPPVVYCDIYLNNLYYKTLSKTAYDKLNTSNSEWQFDIQDAVQEYLKKYLEDNGQTLVLDISDVITKIQCYFRSSGYDSDGLIQHEDLAPIQGTLDVPAVPGTGTASNTFYGLNATLQHEDNQDLVSHLNSFKNRTWAVGTYPLTHRPDRYQVCIENSDSFPIVTNDIPTDLVLHYKPKGQAYTSTTQGIPCVPVTILGSPSLPDAVLDTAYAYSFSLSGTPPYSLTNIVKPAWMTITLTDNVISFSGMPTTGDEGTGITVSFTINNCTSSTVNFSNTIDVNLTASCVPVTFSSSTDLPNVTAGDTYSFGINLAGTAPFSLTITQKPSWMTITLSGSTITFSGTPSNADVGEGKIVDFTVSNCNGASTIQAFDSIKVSVAGKEIMFIKMTAFAGTVKIKDNATGIITEMTGNSQNIFLTTGTFTLQEISAANSDLQCYTTWGGTVIQLFDEASQGDVLTITDLPNTNFIGIFP